MTWFYFLSLCGPLDIYQYSLKSTYMVQCELFAHYIIINNTLKMEFQRGLNEDFLVKRQISQRKTFFSWVLLFHYPGHKYAEVWEIVIKVLYTIFLTLATTYIVLIGKKKIVCLITEYSFIFSSLTIHMETRTLVFWGFFSS